MNPPIFGSPDGSDLPESEVLDLHDDELLRLIQHPRSCVIVARSGAGKTCFLRRLHIAMASPTKGPISHGVQTSTPRLSDISSIEEGFAANERTRVWAEIWRAAIMRSLATQMMCAPTSFRLGEWDEFGLRNDYPGPLCRASECHTPQPVWAQVRAIVEEARLDEQLRRYLAQEEWGDLEGRIFEVLERSRPVALLVDLVDELVSVMPRAWIACQHGLLLALKNLRSSPLGRSVYVIAATREHHYIDLMHRREDSSLRQDVVVLEATESDAKEFCISKVRRLDTDRDPASGKDAMSALLGFATIDNVDRGCTEDALDYLTRHTRSLPRDIVILVSALAALGPLGNGRARAAPDGPRNPRRPELGEEDVRRIVRGYARVYGQEQIAVCSRQLARTLPHDDAVSEHRISTTSTPGGTEHPRLTQRLTSFIQSIGVERLERDALERVREAGKRAFSLDVFESLWQNGLLGHVAEKRDAARPRFFSLRHSNTTLPDSPDYVFHPCLIDSLGLDHEGAGSSPITPVSERE